MRVDGFTVGPAPFAAPARFTIPQDISDQLAGAVASGRADAASWARINPTGSESRFDGDAGLSLQSPPTGDAAAAELAQVKQVQASRTPELDAAARIHQSRTGWDTWNDAFSAISSTQGVDQARRAHELVDQCMHRTDLIVAAAKLHFDRQRPYQVDSSVTTVVDRPDGNPGYPSGHASGAYAAAVILAALLPDRAHELLDAAAQVAYSRVYGGVHFASDIVAGARIATRVATDVLRRAGIALPAVATPLHLAA